ncbi:TetR family transcriptional regulator [Gordonia sp. TBRC 11910]|uniref:TetR family transcriptional regulator n=1 Tax=Gordonia asplenii TaxID=2725283 RepID=A0A848KWM6_9ACTN|nr:TetR family transcriptional regulator [Gordonia asplenii]NMO03010.1 TetR family transcriptional regulator [Gordonia asplenii]
MPTDSVLRDVDRGGRPATTSAHAIAAAAQRLFLSRGFDQTSVEDIASAVGVSRRTFFRYFSTKADVVWVESNAELTRFAALLDASDPAVRPSDIVGPAYISSLSYGVGETEWVRQRTQLILSVPAVAAHANGVYVQWRAVVADFAARRRGETPADAYPIALAHAFIAGSMAAHERWLSAPGSALADHLTEMFAMMLPLR